MKRKFVIFISAFLLFSLIVYLTYDHPYYYNPKIKTTQQKNISSTVIDSTEYKVTQNLDTTNNIYIGHIISLKDLRTKVLYKNNCKFCHGESGKGDGIKARVNPAICPYDLTKETKSDKSMYYVILNGKNYMPSHSKLNDDNINILIIYIKKEFVKK